MRPHRNSITALLLVVLIASCVLQPTDQAGCADPSCPSQADAVAPLRLVQLETYDGSGQAVHPDVAITPPGWGQFEWHLVVTPYPFQQARFENPSIYASHDGVTWVVESGVANPIVGPPVPWGHLADPALVFVSETQELWLYYLRASDSDRIEMVRSSDAVHWSSPVPIGTVRKYLWISPTVVHRAPGDWQMWSVNGDTGCGAPVTWVERRTSSDGLIWSQPVRVHLDQPGFHPWHIDVIWVPSRGQYWALFNAETQTGSCATPAVFFATSSDGLNWTTFPSPVAVRGVIPEFASVVYRSTMAYDSGGDTVRFWYSGVEGTRQGPKWSIATQRMLRADLFRMIDALAPRARGASSKADGESPIPDPEIR